MNIVQAIGRTTLALLRETGRTGMFALAGVGKLLTPPWFGAELMRSFMRIGFTSLPVVGLTAIFTGAALALNIYASVKINAEVFLPNLVAISITRELGPVLAALMVSGRSSSAMAAELGSMRVTEQIDAMSTLAVDPFKYLVAPRIFAATVSMPILVLIADVIGILGGYLVAVKALGFSGITYINNIADFLTLDDIVSGLIKAGVFGFILALMGCYHGYYSRGGAQGVGAATRWAVVSAAVLILASNYVLTSLFVET